MLLLSRCSLYRNKGIEVRVAQERICVAQPGLQPAHTTRRKGTVDPLYKWKGTHNFIRLLTFLVTRMISVSSFNGFVDLFFHEVAGDPVSSAQQCIQQLPISSLVAPQLCV